MRRLSFVSLTLLIFPRLFFCCVEKTLLMTMETVFLLRCCKLHYQAQDDTPRQDAKYT